MVLYLLFVATTMIFGHFLILLIRMEPYQLCFQLSASWLLGSMSTSLIYYLAHFILPINLVTTSMVIGAQLFMSITIRQVLISIHKSKYHPHFRLLPEKSPWIYILLCLVTIIAGTNLILTYSKFPNELPAASRSVFDIESSFVSSVRRGVNKRRRNVFYYKDPLILGQTFNMPSFPLLYICGMCSLFGNYIEASIVVCLLNILATTVFIYTFAQMHTKNAFLTSLAYLFNSGWAFFRAYFGDNCPTNDYVHDVCSKIPIPWYQTVSFFLSFLKSSSYTIPMTLFIINMLFNNSSIKRFRRFYLIAGIFSILLPNPSTTCALFIFASCIPNCWKFFMPFAIPAVLKMKGITIRSFPIWREYQMTGIFFSPFVSMFDSFGPVIFTIMLPFLGTPTMIAFRNYTSAVSCLILLVFFRIGNEYFENIIAITSVCLPIFIVVFINTLSYFIHMSKDPHYNGVAWSFCIIFLGCFIAGGLMHLKKVEATKIPGLDKNDIEIAEFIVSKTKKKSIITTETDPLNPATVIAGRQILCGPFKDLWYRGANITTALNNYREIERNNKASDVMARLGSQYLMCKIGSKLHSIATSDQTQGTTIYQNQKWMLVKI